MKKNNAKVISTSFLSVIALEFGMHCISVFTKIAEYSGIYGFSETDSFNMQMSSLTFLFGITFIVIGNIMPKSKRNGAVGFRTNSSMKNDCTWQFSNRFAGRTMMISGVISVIFALTVKGVVSVLLMIICLILSTAVSCIYSYKLAENQEKT